MIEYESRIFWWNERWQEFRISHASIYQFALIPLLFDVNLSEKGARDVNIVVDRKKTWNSVLEIN